MNTLSLNQNKQAALIRGALCSTHPSTLTLRILEGVVANGITAQTRDEALFTAAATFVGVPVYRSEMVAFWDGQEPHFADADAGIWTRIELRCCEQVHAAATEASRYLVGIRDALRAAPRRRMAGGISHTLLD